MIVNRAICKLALGIALLLAIATIAIAPSPRAGAAGSDPVAAYGFDDGTGTTAADVSGHALTGTLVNGPTWAPGRYGSAVSFDGVEDYVDLGNPGALQITGSMTISGWINSAAFPGDDAAVVSKRASTGYQLDTTIDRGPRSIGFKLTNSSANDMMRYGATALQLDSWYHIAGVYNAATTTMDVYLNGVPDNGAIVGTVTSSQQNSASNVNVGQRASGGYGFNGLIDDVRIYDRALTAAEIQTDMNTSLGGSSSDPNPPTVAIDAPSNNAQVNDIVTVTADASDDVGVAGVQFYVDGVATGAEDTVDPYGLQWDTRTVSNGAHTLTARARDAAFNTTMSASVAVNVANTNFFSNDVLATGLDLPTAIKFLPDGRMLVAELQGTVLVLPPPYVQPDPTPFLQITNVGSAGVQQGIFDLALDPDFANNHYYFIFYTAGSPNRDRLSRFTANAALTGTVPGSESVLYQDPQDANSEHHGGAITFGNDGKLYFTTGEHFNAADAQNLNSPRGKVHRINKDGTIPTDDPFYDGAGPHWDSIWAYGLRNPYRAYYDAPTGRYFIGDVGGNDPSTSREEIDLGAAGANYGWPNSEGACSAPCTSPRYSYPHSGRDASITGGFVYRGAQFPSSYQGSYFFADYTQNWIRRVTLDASGNVNGVFNFEPADGSVDGPYGDIVYLTQGPEGALYYVDLGYSDVGGTFGVSKIRRISYVQSNQAPTAIASANPPSGPTPLEVSFSSAGSVDPEGQPLTYAWTFGDGATSTAANPTHTYTQPGPYTVRLTVSDGVSSTISTPITISAGNPPTATILSPDDGIFFEANDVISFSGSGTDSDGATLPASAFTWNIDFLHDGHVHPGTPLTGVTSGTFTIPTTGHDFEHNTRYRITLTVTDSNGLIDTKSVVVWPTKVNLSFSTVPAGLTLYLDGIAKTTPFVYDTLVGFHHVVEARNQAAGTSTYTFASWSDAGAQSHTIVVPSTAHSYAATYHVATSPATPTFVQVNSATPQTDQSTVGVPYAGAQTAGDINIVAVGWNDATSSITSVTDTAGNLYQLAAPLTRGAGLSQAIYYAKNIKAAAAGANTVTARYSNAVPYADVRITEYRGIDPVNPRDATASAAGNGPTASSGNFTTNAAKELIFGAGMTAGGFTGGATGFNTRVISTPDGDIVADRNVTSAGTYAAGAVLNGSSAWVIQGVTFRAATATVPTAPRSVTARPGTTQATVSWIAPVSNGGSAVTGYVVTPYLAGTAQAARVFNTTATTQVIGGLVNTKSYTFKVAAKNAVGTSTQSVASLAILVALPTAPTGITAVGFAGRAVVSWAAPSSNGGSSITGYAVTPYKAGVAQAPRLFASTALAENITLLTNGVAYTFRVAAINAHGTGLVSAPDTPITIGAGAAPTAPLLPVATPGNGQVTLTWGAPAANGSANVSGYIVTPYIGGVAQPARAFNANTTQVVTGLTNTKAYRFTVVARNAAGNSPPSAMSGPVTVGAPTAPVSVVAVAGNGQATVSWTAPAANNGQAITGYVITPYVGAVAQPAINVGVSTSKTITGLTNTKTYTFRVAAKNANGVGPQSTTSNAVTPT